MNVITNLPNNVKYGNMKTLICLEMKMHRVAYAGSQYITCLDLFVELEKSDPKKRATLSNILENPSS